MNSQQLLGRDSSLADSQSTSGAVLSSLAAASPDGLKMSQMAVPMELTMFAVVGALSGSVRL